MKGHGNQQAASVLRTHRVSVTENVKENRKRLMSTRRYAILPIDFRKMCLYRGLTVDMINNNVVYVIVDTVVLLLLLFFSKSKLQRQELGTLSTLGCKRRM